MVFLDWEVAFCNSSLFLVSVSQCPSGEEVSVCKVVPMKVKEVFPEEERAVVLGSNGKCKSVSTALFTGNLKVGDFVVLQAGYVIEQLATKEALEILRILREAAEIDSMLDCVTSIACY